MVSQSLQKIGRTLITVAMGALVSSGGVNADDHRDDQNHRQQRNIRGHLQTMGPVRGRVGCPTLARMPAMVPSLLLPAAYTWTGDLPGRVPLTSGHPTGAAPDTGAVTTRPGGQSSEAGP